VQVKEWRERCQIARISKGKESSRVLFYKAQEKLREDGIIQVEGPWVSLVSTSESNGGGTDVLH
jgi:hypothetical protein